MVVFVKVRVEIFVLCVKFVDGCDNGVGLCDGEGDDVEGEIGFCLVVLNDFFGDGFGFFWVVCFFVLVIYFVYVEEFDFDVWFFVLCGWVGDKVFFIELIV